MERNGEIATALNKTLVAYTKSGVHTIHFDTTGHLEKHFEDLYECDKPRPPLSIPFGRVSI